MSAVAKIRETQPTEAPALPADALAKLREPFPDHQVSKLPKETKNQADQRKAEQAKGNWPNKCTICGGIHHARAVHLDYVGHAALTDRLLDVDPFWSWEPVATAPDGLPAFDRNGGLWIRLTICGVSRLGYGNADGKSGGDAVKEIIGDALRNAGMRFGAALDLWHKGDLHVDEAEAPGPGALETAINMLRGCGDGGLFKEAWDKNIDGWKTLLSPEDLNALRKVKNEIVAKFLREAEEAKAREEAAKPKGGGGESFASDDPFDDEIPFIRKGGLR